MGARTSFSRRFHACPSVRLPEKAHSSTSSATMSQLGQTLLRKTPAVEPRSVAGSSTSAASYAITGRWAAVGCFCQRKLPSVEKADAPKTVAIESGMASCSVKSPCARTCHTHAIHRHQHGVERLGLGLGLEG